MSKDDESRWSERWAAREQKMLEESNTSADHYQAKRRAIDAVVVVLLFGLVNIVLAVIGLVEVGLFLLPIPVVVVLVRDLRRRKGTDQSR